METEKVWRVHPAIWFLIGPLVVFTGGFGLLYLFSPLLNLFITDKASSSQLAVFYFLLAHRFFSG